MAQKKSPDFRSPKVGISGEVFKRKGGLNRALIYGYSGIVNLAISSIYANFELYAAHLDILFIS